MHASATSNPAPEPLPVALARHLAEWFPDLEGRAFAVTDTDEVWTKETAPTLPLCAVGVVEETYDFPEKSNSQEKIETTIAILFAFEAERYKTSDGRISPFWAYVDHEALRNRVAAALKAFRSPSGGRVLPLRLERDATEVALTFAFIATHAEELCLPADVEAEIEARTLVSKSPRIAARRIPAAPPVCPDCEGQARNCQTCKEQSQPQ